MAQTISSKLLFGHVRYDCPKVYLFFPLSIPCFLFFAALSTLPFDKKVKCNDGNVYIRWDDDQHMLLARKKILNTTSCYHIVSNNLL
mmetsp:Transcript_3636/g.5773  ORF Transcript_3636/g.5773 Transcript_3636/m.5773 type:complete len:87 (-) Transcript_3636:16-276(-)